MDPKNGLLHLIDGQKLRRRMIVMALENKDFETAELLKAREIPELYQWSRTSVFAEFKARNYYDDDLVEAIAKSDEFVLNYFSEEFQLVDRRGNENTFIYPFLGEIIDKLVKNKSSHAEFVIKKAMKHNNAMYKKLADLVAEMKELVAREEFLFICADSEEMKRKIINNEVFRYFRTDSDNGTFSFFYLCGKDKSGTLCSNLIRTTAHSANPETQQLLDELNDSFNKISSLKED